MKKCAAVLAVLLGTALAMLAGCGTPSTTAAPSGEGKPAAPVQKGGDFKVGLVTPGEVTDGGWSQSAYDGLQKIQKETGATVNNFVADSPAKAFAAFRDFAGQDYNLVIGHASEWWDPETLKVAEAHPKTTFLISGGENAKGNVACVRYQLEDACYVLGQIAASMSKSGKIGAVGPEKVAVIESTFYAFEQGAKSVKPDITVSIVWTQDGKDIARAKERTLILIDQGCDFIFHNANNGAAGVFQAVQEKKDKGVLAFGANADQSSMAPDVILASAAIDIPDAFVSLAKSVKDGTFKSEVQFIGMKQNGVSVAYNPKLESKIPADVKKLADETVKKIKSGEFKVPRQALK
jgi:basic membrane protein A